MFIHADESGHMELEHTDKQLIAADLYIDCKGHQFIYPGLSKEELTRLATNILIFANALMRVK